MTKEKLLEIISEKSNLSQQAVDNVIKILGEVISTSLKKSERVIVSGIGVFDVGTRAKRKIIYPNGKLVQLPAMRVPKFRAAISLKKAVRK